MALDINQKQNLSSIYFKKWNLFALIIKHFLYFRKEKP